MMSVFEQSRVLIAGGSGFIGTHLQDALLNAGTGEIVVLHRGAGHADVHMRVRHIVCDLTEPESLSTIKSLGSFDYVFNLVGVTEQEMPHPDPWRLYSDNIVPLVHLCSGVDWGKVKGALHIGSVAEYGNQELPFQEDMAPRPTNCYGSSKAAATQYALMMTRGGFAKWCVARLFTSYGPGLKTGFVADLIRALKRNETFTVKSAHVTRDVVFVGDAVEGLMRLAVCPRAKGEIVNVCSGQEFTLEKIALDVRGILNQGNLLFKTGHHRNGDFVRSCGSNEKLLALVGWKPVTALEDGLRLTIPTII